MMTGMPPVPGAGMPPTPDPADTTADPTAADAPATGMPPAPEEPTNWVYNSVLNKDTGIGCTGYPIAQYQQCPYGYLACGDEESDATGCPWLQGTLKCCPANDMPNPPKDGCSVTPTEDYQSCSAGMIACGETEDGEAGCPWLARRLKCCVDDGSTAPTDAADCAGLMYDTKEKAEACAGAHEKTGAHEMNGMWMVGSEHSANTDAPATGMPPAPATDAPATEP